MAARKDKYHLFRELAAAHVSWKAPTNEDYPDGFYTTENEELIVVEKVASGEYAVRLWSPSFELVSNYENAYILFLVAKGEQLIWKDLLGQKELPAGKVQVPVATSSKVYVGRIPNGQIGTVTSVGDEWVCLLYDKFTEEKTVYAQKDYRVLCTAS